MFDPETSKLSYCREGLDSKPRGKPRKQENLAFKAYFKYNTTLAIMINIAYHDKPLVQACYHHLEILKPHRHRRMRLCAFYY